MNRLSPPQHVHIIGIGGSGMSAIARVLLQQGFTVSGSDRQANAITQALEAQGARVYIGHAAQQVAGAEALIITSAVAPGHVEVEAAAAAGIPIYKRSDIIADLMASKTCIAVAGTHGKTTTTSMTTHILLSAGRDPGYIIGGVLRTSGQNANYGSGPAFVIEADEYDHMFWGLRPQVALLTSVEWDHPDFFPSQSDLTHAFDHFVGLLPADGLLAACADDPGAQAVAAARAASGTPVVWYGIRSPLAEWRADSIHITPDETHFTVWRGNMLSGEVRLRVPGEHNVLNALAALIAADSQGVSFAEASAAIATFEGAGRRFDVRGTTDGVTVIDDYAHHPTAIRVTLAAARARYPGHALWAVWQPHTYSRTQALFDEYVRAFDVADHVCITDIYAAREQPLPGVTSQRVVEALHHPDARFTGSLENTTQVLCRDVQAPAVLLILSAGDAPQIGVDFISRRGSTLYTSGGGEA